MSRESAVKEDLVFQIATQLLLEGVNPSIGAVQERVRATVGAAGSTAVVTRHLKTFWHRIGKRLAPRTRAGIPDHIVALGDELVSVILLHALQHAEGLVLSDRQQANAERLVADERVRLAQIAEEQSRSEAVIMRGRLEEVRGQLDSMTTDRERLARETERLSGEIGRLRAEMSLAAERGVSERERHRALEEALHRDHRKALEAERTAWAGERKLLHEETDRVRQSFNERIQAMQKQMRSTETLIESYRVQAGEAAATIAGLRAALEGVTSAGSGQPQRRFPKRLVRKRD